MYLDVHERGTSRYNQDTIRIHHDTSGYVSDRKLEKTHLWKKMSSRHRDAPPPSSSHLGRKAHEAPAATRIIVLTTNPSSALSQPASPTPASSSFPNARALMNAIMRPLTILTSFPWCSSAQQVARQLRLLQDAPDSSRLRTRHASRSPTCAHSQAAPYACTTEHGAKPSSSRRGR